MQPFLLGGRPTFNEPRGTISSVRMDCESMIADHKALPSIVSCDDGR